MKDFLEYSKRPVYLEKKEKWENTSYLRFVLLYAIIASSTVGFGYLFKVVFDVESKIDQIPYYELIIQGLIVAPIAEELIFRIILRKGKRNFYIFIITCMLINLTALLTMHWDTLIIITTILFVVGGIRLLHDKNLIDIYALRPYRYLYFGSIIIFALLHTKNFIFPNQLFWLISPLLVLPQVGLGFILNYIRIKYGIKYSIVFHFIINTPVLLYFN